eukprot:3941272-Rhodomonas_salina.1
MQTTIVDDTRRLSEVGTTRPPNRQDNPSAANSDPTTSTVVPPCRFPELGRTLTTAGALAYWYESVPSQDIRFARIVNFTVDAVHAGGDVQVTVDPVCIVPRTSSEPNVHVTFRALSSSPLTKTCTSSPPKTLPLTGRTPVTAHGEVKAKGTPENSFPMKPVLLTESTTTPVSFKGLVHSTEEDE